MIIKLLLLIVMSILVILKTKRNLHMLQQNLYNENNRYIKWLKKDMNSFSIIEFVALLVLFLSTSLLVDKDGITLIINIIFILLEVFVILDFIKQRKKTTAKISFAITARIKRLIITISIFYLLVFLFFILLQDQLWISSFLIFIYGIMTFLNPIIIYFANAINKYTVEKLVYFYYKHKAVTKLKEMKNLNVIGITGSYGKTSSKNILADILSIKYLTLPTPKNLNTPYGLIITVNNYLDKFYDVFIAEMGAYVEGEIKELCDLVHPKYGILTRIGTAHLETFGSEEIIQKTKFELIESLPQDGIGVLNKDDEKQTSYHLKNNCRILWIGIENSDVDVRATNIKVNKDGTSFDVIFKGDRKKYPFTTRLLGAHNVYNILAGLALGKEFGISISQLQKAVKTIKPIEHRLELKRIGNFYQIDDAYNSNPIGAKNALEVLSMMPGVKIVVTPGMVELGSKEKEENRRFGEEIAELSQADYVILIGKDKTKDIKEGLLSKKYKEDSIIVYNDVVDAYQFIRNLKTKKDIYALFENDLPDIYNEK